MAMALMAFQLVNQSSPTSYTRMYVVLSLEEEIIIASSGFPTPDR